MLQKITPYVPRVTATLAEPVTMTAVRLAPGVTSASLTRAGAVGSRSFSALPPVDKPLAERASPSPSPDGLVFGRFMKTVSDVRQATSDVAKQHGIKLHAYKQDVKQVMDPVKHSGLPMTMTTTTVGSASREWSGKLGPVDVKAKVEAKLGELSHSSEWSLELHGGKGSADASAAVKNVRSTAQFVLALNGGVSLGHLFFGLKSCSAQLMKLALSAQPEYRDLQTGMSTTFKLNAAKLLASMEGPPGPDKSPPEPPESSGSGTKLSAFNVLSRERKVFDQTRHEAYGALKEAFIEAYQQDAASGLHDKIDSLVDDAVGDQRSDGEGWARGAVEALTKDLRTQSANAGGRSDAIASLRAKAAVAEALGLGPEHLEAVPVFQLAQRFYEEAVKEGRL